MSNKRKLVLITGRGGNRKDFVSGWLGQLAQFDHIQWDIDFTTGRSTIPGHHHNLDWGKNYTIDSYVNDLKIELDSTAEQWIAGAFHGYQGDAINQESHIKNQVLKLFYIDTSRVDNNTIKWEFLVKTWLSSRRRTTDSHYHRNWLLELEEIDREIDKPVITDQDRINKFDEMCRWAYNGPDPGKDLTGSVGLDYNKLFVAGGSRYLCENVGINATTQEHAFWDAMLPFAAAPTEIERWGKRWRKQEYILG